MFAFHIGLKYLKFFQRITFAEKSPCHLPNAVTPRSAFHYVEHHNLCFSFPGKVDQYRSWQLKNRFIYDMFKDRCSLQPARDPAWPCFWQWIMPSLDLKYCQWTKLSLPFNFGQNSFEHIWKKKTEDGWSLVKCLIQHLPRSAPSVFGGYYMYIKEAL